jgi:hypothetical protein
MMRKPIRTRRLIALLAAYVVALQALLLPLTVAAGASFDGSLCSAVSSVESGHQPAGHDTGCPCAAGCGMQCAAHSLAGPPPVASAVRAQTRFSMIAPEPAIEATLQPARRSPQAARAPPLA